MQKVSKIFCLKKAAVNNYQVAEEMDGTLYKIKSRLFVINCVSFFRGISVDIIFKPDIVNHF